MAPAIEAMRNAAAAASRVIQEKASTVIAEAVQGLASAAETIEAGLRTVTTAASDLGEEAVRLIGSAAETVGAVLEEIRTTGKTIAREHLPAVLKKLASGAEGLWAAGETAAVKAVESAAKVLAIALKNVRAAAEATAGLLIRGTARGVRSAVSTIRTALETAGLAREGEGEEASALATVVPKAWSRIQAALDLLVARADQETREGFSEAQETLQSTVQTLGEFGTDEREAAIERITGALDTLAEAVDAVVAQEKDATAALVRSTIEEGVPEAKARARREADRPRGGPGQRLDLLAHRHYGDPALWRVLAAFNNVEHPLHLTSGQLLRVPPASALRSGGK
jgi:nucleoid-associated protein YgaU